MLRFKMKDNTRILVTGDQKDIKVVSAYLKHRPKGWQFSKAYKARRWDGWIKLLTMDADEGVLGFASGLIYEITEMCKERGIQYDASAVPMDKFFDKSVGVGYGEALFNEYIGEGGNFDLRWYQSEMLDAMMKYKRCVVVCSVGGGKSLTLCLAVRDMLAKGNQVLVIVPTIMLLNQMCDDFASYNWPDSYKFVSTLGGGTNYDESKPVLVSTWQSLILQDDDFFARFDAVLCDETHLAKCDSIVSVMGKCVNADYRIGVTGTMPNETLDQLQIKGSFGKEAYKILTDVLQEENVLSQLKIYKVVCKYPEELCESARKNKWSYDGEFSFISKLIHRKRVIVDIMKNRMSDGKNALILCHFVDFIEQVAEMLRQQTDYKIFVIHGKSGTAKQREEIRKRVINESGCILISTYQMMSTGVNIPNLHVGVLATPYKAKAKVIQSIGRILRKHESKEEDGAEVWDIIDDLRVDGYAWENHCYKMSVERDKHYNEYGLTDTKTYIKKLEI